MSNPGCALCGAIEDLDVGRLVGRETRVCGTCKRALYSVIDGANDLDLPTDEVRSQAAEMRPLWTAFRDIQRQIDTGVQQHRDAIESERQEQLRVTREEEERVGAEADAKAKEAMEEAAARAEEEERAASDARAAAKAEANAKETARDKSLADLHEKIDALAGLVANR